MGKLPLNFADKLRTSPVGYWYTEVASYVRPPVRRFVENSRFAWGTMAGEKPDGEEPLRHQWERVLRNSGETTAGFKNLAGTRVLFASGYGFSAAKLALESIIAMGLRLRGAAPLALLCDMAIPACEFNRYGNWIPDPAGYAPRYGPHARLTLCHNCVGDLLDVYGLLGIPEIGWRQYLENSDLEHVTIVASHVPYDTYRDFVYKDIHVGEHAFASMLRATLRGVLLDDEPTRWLYHRYLVSTMLAVDLTERAFAANKPERVVAIHGVYVTHGTLCEVARKHGIPVVVFGFPYRQGTVWLSHSDSYHRTLATESNALWENCQLTPEQGHAIDEYMASRQSGGRDYVTYHPNPIEDAQVLIKELDLDPTRPIISLFTNVIWDAQIYYDFNAFSNILEWLFATIEYFSQRPELQLVIRVHPAEVKGGGMPTRQPIAPEVRQRFPTLPTNVRLIPPESDLSSYTLAEISQAALIYGTKMGLEIALRGIPVVVAGETLSRNKGFTYDISSAAEYFELLSRIETLPRNSPEMIERARRYAYYLFFRRMIDFPLLAVKNATLSTGLRLNFDHLAQLEVGRDAGLDVVCDGILTGSPFVI